MRIGQLLVEQGVATPADIDRALEHQSRHGGRLGDNLVALGIISAEQLHRLFAYTPRPPRTVEETGLSEGFLLDLVLKTVHQTDNSCTRDLAAYLGLPLALVDDLLKTAQRRQFVEAAGEAGRGAIPDTRYQLTSTGQAAAAEALARSGYVGPAPVPMDQYQRQVVQQRLTNEHVTADEVRDAFNHLVVPDSLITRVGPAINSGAALLLYGPPGNGKTVIAEAIWRVFKHTIFVPYAVELAGQVIKIFDPTVHTPVAGAQDPGQNQQTIRAERPDERWVACRRPLLIAGGELTLDMLDMQYEPVSKFYEAPLHLKATNGVFVIDDFGRQRVRPEDILNRWIVPLERSVDYLTLHTGQKFPVEFDQLVVFSTNYPPRQMMDAAMLRRIPYKIEMDAPSREDFKEIFRRVGEHYDVEVPDTVIDDLLTQHYDKQGATPAAFHPKFLMEQVVALCRFRNQAPHLARDVLDQAVANLETSY